MEEMLQSLCGDTRFQAFIDILREQREVAINDLCNDAVVAEPTKLAAGIGEVRMYNNILTMVSAHISAARLPIR